MTQTIDLNQTLNDIIAELLRQPIENLDYADGSTGKARVLYLHSTLSTDEDYHNLLIAELDARGYGYCTGESLYHRGENHKVYVVMDVEEDQDYLSLTDDAARAAAVISIASGEGERGTTEVYTGERTRAAIIQRISDETCAGDRWCHVYLDEVQVA